jgi:pimeloyl-ACP methyl ester carboxylesterase
LRRRQPRISAERVDFIARAWTRPTETGDIGLAFDPWHRLINPVLYRREEAEACWRRATASVLLLLGSESEYRRRLETTGDIAAYQHCFQNVERHDLDGLGHMLHHEAPERVAALVRTFAERLIAQERLSP